MVVNRLNSFTYLLLLRLDIALILTFYVLRSFDKSYDKSLIKMQLFSKKNPATIATFTLY